MMREAVHQVRIMKGQGKPILFLCDDNAPYVVKFGGPERSIRRLASEFIAVQLSRWLGLSTPECSVVNVPEFLISETSKSVVADAQAAYSPGIHFGSRLVGWNEGGDVFDYFPQSCLLEVENIGAFAAMFAFDIWSANQAHRQAIFFRRPAQSKYTAHFIGYSKCFGGDRWVFEETVNCSHRHPLIYRDITGWENFEPFLDRLISIPSHVVDGIAGAVPPEWYEGRRSDLDKLVEALLTRRARVHALIDEARSLNSQLFPSWRSKVYMSQTHNVSLAPKMIGSVSAI